MAELVLEGIIAVLIEKTVTWSGQYVLDYFFEGGEGIHDRMKKWSNTLRRIRAVLKDAEQKQFTSEEVKLWLDDLYDLAYDIEDVGDELANQARPEMTTRAPTSGNKFAELMESASSLVEDISRRLKPGDEMKTKIEEISRRLDDIFERKKDLGLNSINVVAVGERMETSSRETTSLPPSRVIGREKEKEEIVEMLMKSPEPDSAEVSAITILGMGGMGKTTLAQDVYQDKQVESFFDLRAWVCVSDVFDVVGITKAVLKSIDCKDKLEKLNLNKLQEKLKEMLLRKKFLVVFDNIWNEKHGEWEQLLRPFHSGAAGSKILATTRNESVASAISLNNSHYNLKYLGDNHCLSLLALHALGKDDFSQHPHLKGSGEQIVKKCGRLPLAIKTVAGLLRSKPQRQRQRQWEDVINSNKWTEDSNGILPALRLSYYHLPSHLKRCFAYCSIIPKDYIFDKNELILLWMAEGFLEQPAGGYNIRMEDFGDDCFQELLSRSFFQLTGGSTTEFIMHDLINDLAVHVAGERCFRMDDKWDKTWEYKISERTRHFSSIIQHHEVSKKFDVFNTAQRSRTFLALPLNKFSPYTYDNFYKGLVTTLSRFQSLRVLSLRGCHSFTELPNDSIGALKHLRYLNLSDTCIEKLPQLVCSLYNLQTLSLNYCPWLRELPSSIGCLTNLRHLELEKTSLKIPSGIGKLKSLQTLSKIIMWGDTGSSLFNLKDLKDLRYLHGTLYIDDLQNVTDDRDAVAADLRSKEHLEILKLRWFYLQKSWFYRQKSVGSADHDKQVLENLQPHCNLKELKIKGYGGVEFPSWVGELPRLRFLNITNCQPLEKLPNGLHGLASLEEMWIKYCPSLVWDATDLLPKSLINLTLINCTKSLQVLSNLGFHRLTSLRRLDLWEFEEVVSFEKGVGVKERDSNTTSTSYLFPPSLTLLSIGSFPNLESLSNSLQNLTSLRELYIGNCPKLESLAGADDDQASLQIISSLHKLTITGNSSEVLRKHCEEEEGKYWPTIQHIPDLYIRNY